MIKQFYVVDHNDVLDYFLSESVHSRITIDEVQGVKGLIGIVELDTEKTYDVLDYVKVKYHDCYSDSYREDIARTIYHISKTSEHGVCYTASNWNHCSHCAIVETIENAKDEIKSAIIEGMNSIMISLYLENWKDDYDIDDMGGRITPICFKKKESCNVNGK